MTAPSASLVELGRLFDGAQNTAKGGRELEVWIRHILRVFTSDIPLEGLGGLLVPQVGEGAGKEITFLATPVSRDIDPEVVAKTTSDFWSRVRLSAVTATIPSSPSHSCIVVPISSGFDRSIGFLWAVAANATQGIATVALESVANLVAIVVRAEIASDALERLSRPTWISTSTTQRSAEDIARVCQKAMACAAVVIWEAQDVRRSLRTLAVVSDQPLALNLDLLMGQGIVGKCALDSRIILVDDLTDPDVLQRADVPNPMHPEVIRKMGWRAALYIPLDTGGRTAGVLAAFAFRPRAFTQIDVNIISAFGQRLAAGYAHIGRLQQLAEMEHRLALEAPAIEAGIRAMERVHDADNNLLLAQSQLSSITERFRHQPRHPINEFATAAATHVDAAHKVIRSLVRRAKVLAPVLTPRFLHELLAQVIDEVSVQASTVGVRIHLDCAETIRVRADKEQLPRVFLNLLTNSLYFLETDSKGGSKRIDVKARTTESNTVTILVCDNGPGIDPSSLSKVFDYFFTTRGARGMGFGLAIAKSIVIAHQGTISVRSKWGYDTEFIIVLPTLSD